MSFTEKIDVLELLIDILHEHENSLDTLISRLEIVENTVKNAPNNKSLDYEGTLLEETQYKHILVVDDDKDLAKTFKFILDETGSEVELAYTGIEALGKMSKTYYDLVILDINLPDMLGYEVAEKMNENGKTTEYVYITGYQQLKENIPDDDNTKVLSKPIEPEKLIEITATKIQTTNNR